MTVVELPRPGRPGPARLFPDQAEAVMRLAQHLRRAGTRALFVSATGTGKTLVSTRMADKHNGSFSGRVNSARGWTCSWSPPGTWRPSPRWHGAGTDTAST